MGWKTRSNWHLSMVGGLSFKEFQAISYLLSIPLDNEEGVGRLEGFRKTKPSRMCDKCGRFKAVVGLVFVNPNGRRFAKYYCEDCLNRFFTDAIGGIVLKLGDIHSRILAWSRNNMGFEEAEVMVKTARKNQG